MVNKFLFFFFTCFLFLACQNRQYQTRIDEMNLLLDSLISEQYRWLSNLDTTYTTRWDYPDSIYNKGNYLVDHINMQDTSLFMCLFNRLNKEFGKPQFAFNSNDNVDFKIMKIKLLQYHALSKERQYFYEGHFQVDLMGFTILNNTITKGKTERLCIVPFYRYGDQRKTPVLIINCDTIKSDNSYPPRYYYDFCCNKKDTVIYLKAKIKIWLWDDYLTIEASSPVFVK